MHTFFFYDYCVAVNAKAIFKYRSLPKIPFNLLDQEEKNLAFSEGTQT